MSVIVIAHNNSSTSISINDLGVELLPNETRNLTDYFDYPEITESDDLKNYVSSGDIGINDGTNDLNISDALKHLYFESEHLDLLQDESMVGNASELSCSDVSNINVFSVPSSWSATNFPITDFENNSAVIEHDTSNTERILIKEDGIYDITVIYEVRVNTSNFGKCYYRITKNGSTVISNEKYQNLYRGEVHCYTDSIVRKLNSGDYITSQIRTDDNVDILSCSMKIIKQEGIKGDTGAPGGTTIDIQKNDTTIVTHADKINFEGNVTVNNDGNNKATITIIPPHNEFRYVNLYDSRGHVNINQSTAQPYKWDSQLVRDTDTFDHSTLINASRLYFRKKGLYKISYCMCYDGANNSRKNIKCYFRLNGNSIVKLTSTGSYVRNNYDDYGSNTLPPVLSWFTVGDYIELMYHREGSYGTAYTYGDQCWMQAEFIRGA